MKKISCSVQTNDPPERKKTFADEFSFKSKKKIKEETRKTVIQTPQTYRKFNVTSYMKKRSAHMGDTLSNLSMKK